MSGTWEGGSSHNNVLATLWVYTWWRFLTSLLSMHVFLRATLCVYVCVYVSLSVCVFHEFLFVSVALATCQHYRPLKISTLYSGIMSGMSKERVELTGPVCEYSICAYCTHDSNWTIGVGFQWRCITLITPDTVHDRQSQELHGREGAWGEGRENQPPDMTQSHRLTQWLLY